MESTARAMKTWLSQFGWPVYGADDVPHDADLPYITVPVKEPTWDQKTQYMIQLWAYTKENAALMQLADTICAAVGVGVRIPCTGGLLVIWPDNPLQQVLPEGNVRRILITFQMNAYHCPGV